jgi:hypothetical protein
MDLKTMTDATLNTVKSHKSDFAEKQAALNLPIGTSSPIPWYEYRTNLYGKNAVIGLYDCSILSIQELQPERFKFSMRDIGANRNQQLSAELQNEVEMIKLIDSWFDKIEWWASRLTNARLQPNQRYRILQDFKDCYGMLVQAGTSLTFKSQNYVPYHGGHSLQFDEMTIQLQDEDSAEILSNFDNYFEEIS